MSYFINKINKVIFLFQSIENKSYIFSRFISVTIKPLLLFICMVYDFREFGTLLAMIFLVTSVNMFFSSTPIFRDHFLNINNKSNLKKKYFKHKYKFEIVIIYLISIIFLVPLNKFFENSFEIFFCSIIIFSVEKIHDEIQRILILKKKFHAYSFITNLKNISLIIFLLSPLLNINLIYLSIFYFFINFYKQYKYIELSFNFNLFKNLKKFFFSLVKNKKIYFLNYMVLFFTLSDKIVVGKIFTEHLTEYFFISQIFSIPILFILYFYISKYRFEFVNNAMIYKNIILSRQFNYLLTLTFIPILICLLFFYYLEFFNISLLSSLTLLLIFVLRAYSSVLDEIIYWKSFYKDFFLIEFLFFLIFIIYCFFAVYLNVPLTTFLLTILILLFIRFIFKYIILTKKNHAN